MESEESNLIYRTDTKGNIVIINGGNIFVNPVEVATANYFSTGDKKYSELIPENYSPLTLVDACSKLGFTWDTDELLADFINPSYKSFDLAAQTVGINIPGPLGVAVDFSGQFLRDSNENYNFLHKIARGSLMVVEGQVSSWWALTVSSSVAITGASAGPSDIAFFLSAYAFMDFTASTVFDAWNDQGFFPFLDNLFERR